MRHPQQAAAVARPQMRLKTLEDRTVRHVVHQLRLALEVGKVARRAEAGLQRTHERGGVAVAAEMPVVIGVGIPERPAIGLGNGGSQRIDRGQRWGADLDRKALRQLGEIAFRRPIVVRATVLQIDPVGTAGVVAGAIELRHQICQPLVEQRLRNSFVARKPDGDRRVISIAADDVAGVVEEQLRILDFNLEILGRFPEIVQYQQAIFIGQIVEHLLGILTEPVADDVQVRGLVQLEIRLQPFACDAFE